jgi:HlyD family secretion protein
MKAAALFSKKTTRVVSLALILLTAAGFGIYTTWQTRQDTLAASQVPVYETSNVIRGSITLGANGTGKVITSSAADLSFSAAGTISKLNVQPGDTVTRGEILAALDNTDELKTALKTAQLNLETAQRNLNDLLSYPEKNIAEAQLTLSIAQGSLDDAKKHLLTQGQQRCSDDLTLQYYYATLHDQHYVNYYGGLLGDMANNGFGEDFLLKNLNYSQKILDRDTNNYTYCQGYTQDEINASQANLKVADAKVKQAEVALQNIQANNGVDAYQLALDKAEIANAELQVTTAQKKLDGATLISPIDGTVLSVAGNLGDSVGSGSTTTSTSGVASTTISQAAAASSASISADTTAFITVADLTHPIIDTSIDQADYQTFKEGCSANVSSDAYPGKKFTGTVTLVAPALAETDGYEMVKGEVEIDTKTQSLTQPFPLGLSTTVEVICQQSTNVLMVPSESLKDVNGSQADVYVLNAAGTPEKRQVTLGLSNGIYTEVSSGLSSGEKVITKGVPTL